MVFFHMVKSSKIIFIIFLSTNNCTFTLIHIYFCSCEVGTKVVTRVVYALIYIITMLILIFAPREDAFINASLTDNVYDHSIIPRIAISLVLMIFAIVAGVFGVQQLAETKTVSTKHYYLNN